MLEGLAAIKTRGHSTRDLPKRSYTLHTMDATTNQTKVPLLGLPMPASRAGIILGLANESTHQFWHRL